MNTIKRLWQNITSIKVSGSNVTSVQVSGSNNVVVQSNCVAAADLLQQGNHDRSDK